MVTLDLKVRLLFDHDPSYLEHIEHAVFDAILKWYGEGLITHADEEAEMLGVDLVEIE